LLFPKKLVFKVGKKAMADRQALLQFLVSGQVTLTRREGQKRVGKN
jgi:hypothetical protein